MGFKSNIEINYSDSKNLDKLKVKMLSPDKPKDGFQTHKIFLSQNKLILENLEKIPATGSYILIAPIKIKGLSECTVRVVGFVYQR